MGCTPAKKNEKVGSKDKPEKKGKNFDDVLEDIMDIKAVQIKGDMLISETIGKPKDHYDTLENIAAGNFGMVKKVKNKFSGCIRAMKTIKKAFIDLQEDEKNFMKEIAILRSLDHINIIKIYEFYQDEKSFYLISEYCHEGDLFDKLQKVGSLPEHAAAYIIYQIFTGISYCHSNNIVHRDIKAENILIESTKVEIIDGKEVEIHEIRLTDFSSARSYNRSKKLTKKVGTPYYIAPEVLKRSYNEKSDIWSIGVLLFILLCGKPPFWGDNDKEIIANIEKGVPDKRSEEWRLISPEAQNLLFEHLLKADHHKRYSAGEAIKHPWFQKFLIRPKFSVDKITEFYKNIISFKTDTKYFFQQASLAYMVHHILKKEETEPLRKFFEYLDKDGDGKMAYSEIVEGFKKIIHINDKDVMKVFKYIDQAKAGYIEYEEFIRACIDRTNLLTEDHLKTAFILFTKQDEFKTISCQEFKFILGLQTKFNEKTWENIIKAIDINKDGQIELNEFSEMMKKFIE